MADDSNPNPIRRVPCKFCGTVFLQRLFWQVFCPGGICRKAYYKREYENKQRATRDSRIVTDEAPRG